MLALRKYRFLLIVTLKLLHYYLEDDCDNRSYVKKKLDDVLQKRVKETEARRQAEEREKMRVRAMTKRQKEKYKYEMIGRKKKRKSVIQEIWDIHESYQLLLAEHHKRVIKREKQDTQHADLVTWSSTSTLSSTIVSSNTTGDDNFDDFARFDVMPLHPEDKQGQLHKSIGQ